MVKVNGVPMERQLNRVSVAREIFFIPFGENLFGLYFPPSNIVDLTNAAAHAKWPYTKLNFGGHVPSLLGIAACDKTTRLS